MSQTINIETFYKSFPTLSHKRNRFPFEKEINFNMKMGEITPITCIRTVPGQTYNLDLATVLRVAPLQAPPMDNAVLKIFAFHNPDRNVWTNYKYWFGEKQKPENPELEPTYIMPKVTLPKGGFAYNSFYDNIGCNPAVGNYKIDATIPRTDREIYNYYFRNQNLENPLEVNHGDEDDDPTQNMELRKISKPRDYFTQCLPTQSGTSPVEIPLGSEAPVIGTGYALGLKVAKPGDSPSYAGVNGAKGYYHMIPVNKKEIVFSGASGMGQINDNNTIGSFGVSTDPNESGLVAQLAKAAGAPLDGLYQAIAYNTYQYMASRGGSRYFEMISNLYGTVNPDGVLQQPEFLGSLSQMIEFDTITQTSDTSGQSTPLAHRASNGYCENYGGLINKSFGEFGWIMIYAVVTCYPKYQQGVSKLMQTDDKLELFNPLFNLIGDEAVYNSELYVQDDEVVDEEGIKINDKVFGYGKRFAKYLYPVNEIHGEQRSQYELSLDTNHFGQEFKELPVLNKEFDKVTDESFKRCLQITDETQFIGNCIITGTQDIEIPLNPIPNPIPNLSTT